MIRYSQRMIAGLTPRTLTPNLTPKARDAGSVES